MPCKVCDQPTVPLFQKLVLKKHTVDYFRCQSCGFIQTEEPYWLEEAYSSAISDLDLGPVNRAIRGARVVEGVIFAGFDPNGTFLDWGGGYGVFTRLMRDIGYDFYWSDLYCENLFAKQFRADERQGFELMTAFEVFEHLVDPVAAVTDMLKRSGSILFTTAIPPTDPVALANWWYLTLEHGQHVSLYSVKSLQVLAERFGLQLTTSGTDTHLLSKTVIPHRLFDTIVRDRNAALLWRRWKVRTMRPHSKLLSDFRTVTGWTV